MVLPTRSWNPQEPRSIGHAVSFSVSVVYVSKDGQATPTVAGVGVLMWAMSLRTRDRKWL